MEGILDLTKENIQQVVDASMQQVVVLTFWSQQSPESIALADTLQNLAISQGGRFVLAKVNCDQEMEIANYFQIQNLPTTLVLKEGKPVDGFAGVQEPVQIQAMLDQHLPKAWQIQLNQAKALLVDGDVTQALGLLQQAYSECQQAEVALVYADALLSADDINQAQVLLDNIGLADQDSYYQSLKAKLSLALDAADTPEIRSLIDAVEAQPDDLPLVLSLAKALHSAKRDEEALTRLFAILQRDISAQSGDVKQLFMEILTALGQANPLANQYRRKLYSLLY
ncbi:tetratricopeptide repeat protein [Shewanella colwelliana]|uniref:tetratricopeptide repeat protein n=1 Tax=Shewanella colwelliana TaxID=23 RepID=UPI0022AF9080|nr:tetratricopeptide repeat protein [Shewanella colwelliana]MCZ4336951.1 tetratricopeptide repeat protein [Shewanella colwelliana]MDX1280294.1 tetratricopeptide repeat protein [Shewanella colwelliana]